MWTGELEYNFYILLIFVFYYNNSQEIYKKFYKPMYLQELAYRLPLYMCRLYPYWVRDYKKIYIPVRVVGMWLGPTETFVSLITFGWNISIFWSPDKRYDLLFLQFLQNYIQPKKESSRRSKVVWFDITKLHCCRSTVLQQSEICFPYIL